MFIELTTLAVSPHGFGDLPWLAPSHTTHSVCFGRASFAVIFSDVLANSADLAIFLVCCATTFVVRRRVFSAAALQRSANPKSDQTVDKTTFWVQATIFLVGLSHLVKLSIFPDSFQLLSTVIQVVAVCSAVFALAQFRPLPSQQTRPADSSVSETDLTQTTGQLERNQRRLAGVEGNHDLELSAEGLSARQPREGRQRRHEIATDRATEAVYWARENGRLFYVNEALCRQLEYSKDELLNRRVSDFNTQVTPNVWAKQWMQVKQDRFLMAETSYRSKSGQVTPVRTNSYFYEVDSEQFLVVTARDITAEKRATAALAAKSAELEQLLKSLPLGMVFVNRDRKIIRVNSELCRMFGYTSSELEGQTAQLLYISEEDFVQAGNHHAVLCEGPEPRRFMAKYQRKNGDMLRAETVEVVLTDNAGEVSGYLGLIRDYSEQWEVERALRKTQAALDASADAVLWIQQNGRITYANEVACQRLQYSKDELEQLTVADINPDLKSAEDFTTKFWPSIKEQGQIVVELHHRRRDGTVFPVEIVSNLQTFEGDEFTCSFIRDISERVKFEQQLLEAQAKLELAVESGNVNLWEWDWETGEIQISDDFCRSLGENPGTFATAEDWRRRMHPDDAREELLVIRQFKQSTDTEYDRTYRVRHRDGGYRWLLSRGRLYRRPNGHPHRLVGSNVDITILRQAQQRTDAYLKLIGTTDGSWDWDVERDAVIYSPRFFDLLGFSGGEFDQVPRSISFLKQQIHAEDRALFWQKIDEHFCSHEFFDHEVRLQIKGGKFRWFRFRAQTIFDADNRPLRMAGSIYDVTEHKEVELQLRRSNNDLEQFAYVASHDLKEPLRAISGFCSLLKLKYDDQLDDDGRDYIRHAVDGAVRMQKLIEDLLSYARTGRDDEAKQIVDLGTCVDEAIRNLESTIVDANAEIILKELPNLECYPGLISRLFQNLISNAIKFAREGVPPEIRIDAKQVEDGPHKNIQVSIADNGIGVDLKHQEQIFHLFKRLHYADKIPGTGLGLAICHRIVERHQGRIQVVPNDQGSTFLVSLPTKVKE